MALTTGLKPASNYIDLSRVSGKAGAGEGPWLLPDSEVTASGVRFGVAGEEGLEPSNGGSKVRCLTTWRLPSGTTILMGVEQPR